MANLPLPENGDVWLNAEQRALKYHVNDVNQTLLPQDWFIAGTPIEEGEDLDKPGYVVSLINQGGNPRVVRTDSATTLKTIGINLNIALNEGDPVEVQKTGLYYYDEINWPTAPFLTSEIGEIAYVKNSPDGQITTDKNAAVLDGNNLIVVGQIVSEREILVFISGDGRGPTDYSEIEYTTGEELDASGTPVLVCIKEDGKIYRASKHVFPERYNVVGFVIGVTGIVPVDSRVIVLQSGKLIGFSGLTPGLPVYASGGSTDDVTWGTITQNPASIIPYDNKTIYVGHAYSSTVIITNVLPAYSSYDETKIGSIILCDSTKTEPDSGFLFMDGSVYNAVINPEYQNLYEAVGNIWGGTDNTDFVLENLNTGLLKYQIKFEYFYQKPPVYTPVYRIEYPTSTTWEAYVNSDKEITTASFGVISEEIMKEIDVAVYAKKDSNVVKLPDLFYRNPGTGNEIFGYNLVYVDPNHVQLNIATNGLAYIDNTNTVIVLDATWSIKIILTKNERYNNYRDTDADMKLNYVYAKSAPIFNEIGIDTNLIGLWDFDTFETGQTIILEHSGNNLHITPYNLTSIEGILSKGVSLNGTTSYFDTMNMTTTLAGSSKFAVAFWNKVSALSNTSTLLRWGTLYGNGIKIKGNASASGNVILTLSRNSFIEDIIISNFFSTTWAFYCIEIDNIAKTYSVWKNNDFLQTGTFVNTMVMPTENIRIGQYNSSEYLTGSIDELRVYKDLISIEDKNFLYELGKMNSF